MLGLLTPMEGSLSISDININDDIEAYKKKVILYSGITGYL